VLIELVATQVGFVGVVGGSVGFGVVRGTAVVVIVGHLSLRIHFPRSSLTKPLSQKQPIEHIFEQVGFGSAQLAWQAVPQVWCTSPGSLHSFVGSSVTIGGGVGGTVFSVPGGGVLLGQSDESMQIPFHLIKPGSQKHPAIQLNAQTFGNGLSQLASQLG
jgi:hypothetical protein